MLDRSIDRGWRVRPDVHTVYPPPNSPVSVKARIVRVGNSRGIRLPRVLLEQAGLSGAEEPVVELHAEPGRIVIAAVARPRAGWAEAAARQRDRGDDALLDGPTPTRFDAEEWTW